VALGQSSSVQMRPISLGFKESSGVDFELVRSQIGDLSGAHELASLLSMLVGFTFGEGFLFVFSILLMFFSKNKLLC
jgi:hypothetical protein